MLSSALPPCISGSPVADLQHAKAFPVSWAQVCCNGNHAQLTTTHAVGIKSLHSSLPQHWRMLIMQHGFCYAVKQANELHCHSLTCAGTSTCSHTLGRSLQPFMLPCRYQAQVYCTSCCPFQRAANSGCQHSATEGSLPSSRRAARHCCAAASSV